MAALINNNNYNNILPYDTKKRWLIIFTNEKNNLKKRYFRFTRMQKRYFIIDPTNVEIIYFVNHHSSLPSDRNFKKDITDLTLGLDFVNTLKPSQYNLKLEEDISIFSNKVILFLKFKIEPKREREREREDNACYGKL